MSAICQQIRRRAAAAASRGFARALAKSLISLRVRSLPRKRARRPRSVGVASVSRPPARISHKVIHRSGGEVVKASQNHGLSAAFVKLSRRMLLAARRGRRAASEHVVVRVAVDAPQHAGLARPLDLPKRAAARARTLVRVPLGRREVPASSGTRAAREPATEAALRPIAEVCDALPPLSARLARSWSTSPPPTTSAASARSRCRCCRRNCAGSTPSWPAACAGSHKRPAAPTAPADAGRRAAGAARPAQAAAVAQLRRPRRPSRARRCCTASPAAARPRSTCAPPRRRSQRGRQALVLVPEINLTPQLEARFAARFPGRAHRRAAQRPDAGAAPAPLAARRTSAAADLVLGTRLAVFASLPRLGLIVVDEEHDPSYKQQEGARYSARDLAVYRGRLEAGAGAARLGHAVARELAARRQRRRYRAPDAARARIGGGALPPVRAGRHGRALPRAPRRRRSRARAAAASRRCASASRAASRACVFLNRRGYAPVLHCADCGWKSGCPHCSAWRVFHKQRPHAALPPLRPRRARAAGLPRLRQPRHRAGRPRHRAARGAAGARCCPDARIARIDADSTRRKGALEAQLGAVHAGEVDVLVGTQMVAKGHDFRRITLVAAVNPDTALFSSDFRAPERLFALLMQAAGRAGRDAASAAPQRDVGPDLAPAPSAVRGAGAARLRRLRGAAAARARSAPACRRSRTWRCCAPRRRRPRRRAPSCSAAGAAGARAARGGGGDDLRAGAARRGPRGRRRAHADAGRVGARGRRCSACCTPGCRRCTPCASDAGARAAHAALGRRRRPAGDLNGTGGPTAG